jgi:uncharacterized membrane protein
LERLSPGPRWRVRWLRQPFLRPPPPSLGTSLLRNIEALQRRRRDEEAGAGFQERFAKLITRFTGSVTFVYVHALVYGFWIAANVGSLPGVRPWDPTFVVLAMIASVESIFMSTFILITQNRMAAGADEAGADGVGHADRLDVPHEKSEVEQLKRNIAPEAVLDAIEGSERLAEEAGVERP